MIGLGTHGYRERVRSANVSRRVMSKQARLIKLARDDAAEAFRQLAVMIEAVREARQSLGGAP